MPFISMDRWSREKINKDTLSKKGHIRNFPSSPVVHDSIAGNLSLIPDHRTKLSHPTYPTTWPHIFLFLKDTLEQITLDKYRIFHPKQKNEFFSSSYGNSLE